MTKYIAYYRVSTIKQGGSGLGLSAQRESVKLFLKGIDPASEFTDIESGKNNQRPELLKAISASLECSGTLVIAKLDRLSRNVAFISKLMESGVKFVCCDMPDATNLTIHIFAALAQWERERISLRTKEALRQSVLRGKKLGSPQNLTVEARLKGVCKIKSLAIDNENNKRARETSISLKENGLNLIQIADRLNSNGFKTRMNKTFKPESVRRLLSTPLQKQIF